MRHRDPELLRRAIGELAVRLRSCFGKRLLGPMAPPVDRIRGEYLMNLLLKIESGASSARAREILQRELNTLLNDPKFKQIIIISDVDPQ